MFSNDSPPKLESKQHNPVVVLVDDMGKGELVKIKKTPQKVELADLDDDGRLIVTFKKEIKDIIADRIAKGTYSGRLTKEELELLLGEKPTCGAIYEYDVDKQKLDLYWVYKGIQQPFPMPDGKEDKELGHLLEKGGCAAIKILQKEDDDEWFVVKLIPVQKDEIEERKKDEREFQIAKRMRTAPAMSRQFRFSPSKKRWQEEFIIKWVPGKQLYYALAKLHQLPSLLVLELVNNILQALIDFQDELNCIHRDIKVENFIAYLTQVTLIDAGHALQLEPGQKSINCQVRGTRGYFDTDIIQNKKPDLDTYDYTKKNDMYSVAVVLAICLNLHFELEHKGNNGFGSFKTVNKSDQNYKNNKLIPDEKDRDASFDLIQQMLGNIAIRPESLQKCKAHFHKLYLKAMDNTVLNACIINVDEFLSATKEVRARLVQQAAKFHKLCFVGFAKKYNEKQLITVYQAFAEQDLYCDEVAKLDRKYIYGLKTLLDKSTHASDPGKKYKFTFVTEQALSPEEQVALQRQDIEFPKPKPALAVDDRFARMMGKTVVLQKAPAAKKQSRCRIQ